MSTVIHRLKSRLKGTWIRNAVRSYKGFHLKGHSGDDGKGGDASDQNASYDRQTVEVMSHVLRRNSNCIDVGAHVGDILRHMINISPLGKHYAFEPLPDLSQKLTESFPLVIVRQYPTLQTS
jgi:hypothetical protein